MHLKLAKGYTFALRVLLKLQFNSPSQNGTVYTGLV